MEPKKQAAMPGVNSSVVHLRITWMGAISSTKYRGVNKNNLTTTEYMDLRTYLTVYQDKSFVLAPERPPLQWRDLVEYT